MFPHAHCHLHRDCRTTKLHHKNLTLQGAQLLSKSLLFLLIMGMV